MRSIEDFLGTIMRATKGSLTPDDVQWKIGVAPLGAMLRGYGRTFRDKNGKPVGDPDEWTDV